MKSGSSPKKTKSTSTWKFFKAALVDHFQQKAVRVLSGAGFVLSLSLVFGANIIFHGGDHTQNSEPSSSDSSSSSGEPAASDQKISNGSENRKSEPASRTIASVSGAVQSAFENQNAPSAYKANLNQNNSASEHHGHFDAPNSFAGAPTVSQPQMLWNNGNGGAPSANSNTDNKAATNGITGSQDQATGGNGSISSSAVANPTPAASATTTTESGTVSPGGFYESNGHLSTSTTPSVGFAIVAGGSLGTGTGMQIDATIGQVTSPNIQNGTGLTLVSGLTGPVMVNF